jgi:squalene-hopene/tetraprenyl-beta-curcumene cyclase
MDGRERKMDDGRRAIAYFLSPILLCGALALAAAPLRGDEEPAPGLDLSTKKDALRAADQGIQWLKARQNADGSWPASQLAHSTGSGLAVTAFATRAILRDPAREPGKLDASAGKGLEFIASCAQKGGGLCGSSSLPDASSIYSTAASLLALAGSRQARYEPLILAARRYLARAQNRRDDSEQFGGWADVKTTALAIEALAATERISAVDAEKNHSAPADPDWAAAVAFLSRCQNLAPGGGERRAAGETRSRPAGPRSLDFGGFFSGPGQGLASRPGGQAREKDGTGLPARHCEGAATALGLTALLEANVARSDPRVVGAAGWLRSNYTLDEQAGGLGRSGLYFYYHALADALSLYGEEPLLRPEARPADWRRELMIRLISLQRADSQGLGYWVNQQGDPAEKDPVLSTAYCVLTLEALADEAAY